MQILQMSWVLRVACKVHCGMVKSQKKDGLGNPYVADDYGRGKAESDRETDSGRHLGLSEVD